MPTINAICQYHRHNLHRRTIIPHCQEFPVCRRRRLGCLSVGRPSVRRRSEEERSLDSLPPVALPRFSLSSCTAGGESLSFTALEDEGW
eukprot:scaffold2214_cov195-Alexandrium_tamarense.AAC.4